MRAFRNTVWKYYHAHGRTMPWRTDPSPFKVFISEVMLQQTQVPRVLGHFPPFITQFPDFESLATATPAALIRAWQGLGYNRRALALGRAAKIIVGTHGGILPRDEETLDALPGIGPATAASIAAFAFNVPTVFLETNIRTVFIHHFFRDKSAVPDSDLLPLVAKALPRDQAREWYWALMDYGTFLKRTVGNESRRARTYTRQKPFAGSMRRLRGIVLAAASKGPQTVRTLKHAVEGDPRLGTVLETLASEGFLSHTRGRYLLRE